MRPRQRRQSGWVLPRVVLLLAVLLAPSPLLAQDAEPVSITFSGIEMVLTGRIHAQFNTTSVDGQNPAEFLLRRVRFGLDVQVNDVVSGRIHPDYGRGRIGLGDAYMQVRLSPAFAMQAGRSHRPFGFIEQSTSLRNLPIERGVSIRGVAGHELSDLLNDLGYSDRDVGLRLTGALPGAPLGLSYTAGVFNGPAQNVVGGETSLQYVARLDADLMDNVAVGVAFDHHDFAGLEGGSAAVEGGNGWVADVEIGGPTPRPGLHVVGEVSTGTADPFTDSDFVGAQAWAGYRIASEGTVSRWEPFFRVSHVSIDDSAGPALTGGTLFTPGFNIYVGGLNRIMFNYDIFTPETGDTESSFKTQFQMTF